MFGLFSPRCPLDIREKTWVDLRMDWLVERLGSEAIRRIEVLTPSDAHFPEAYSGKDQEIEFIFDRVCEQMRVPRETINLSLFDGIEQSPFALVQRATPLGVYEQRETESGRHTVRIERRHTRDAMHLVATAAHELAHAILLGNELLTNADADHEFVTDLLPVMRGLGIFTANATLLEETHQLDQVRWRSVSKAGYLPSRMFGYALAVFAWLRDESKPTWARYLRGDPSSVFKSALSYLQKTGDCLCRLPNGLGRDTPRNRHARLTSENPGIRLSAFWELRRPDPVRLNDDEWSALVESLDGRDPIHVSEAARAIVAVGRPDLRVAEKCVDMLVEHGTMAEMLSTAAQVLATQSEAFKQEPLLLERAADELLKLLEHQSQKVVSSALTAIGDLQPKLDGLGLCAIVEALRSGLVQCDDEIVGSAARTLHVVCESPLDLVKNAFAADLELRNAAHAVLSTRENVVEDFNPVRLPTSASLPIPLPNWRPSQMVMPDPGLDALAPPHNPI